MDVKDKYHIMDAAPNIVAKNGATVPPGGRRLLQQEDQLTRRNSLLS